MSLFLFYHCICVFLCHCRSFKPSLCLLSMSMSQGNVACRNFTLYRASQLEIKPRDSPQVKPYRGNTWKWGIKQLPEIAQLIPFKLRCRNRFSFFRARCYQVNCLN